METKFTPGPWEAVFPNDRPPYISADSRDTVIVSMPYWKHEYQEEVKANAHLIASAPDLYDAIMAVKKAIESGIEVRGLGEQILFGEAIEKCRLALQKADGIQQEGK